VLAVTLFTTAAVAGDDETGWKDSQHSTKKFNKLDTDQDGQLSKQEASSESTLSAQFASIDQDGDGYVSKSEFTAMAQMDRGEGSSRDRQPSDYTRGER